MAEGESTLLLGVIEGFYGKPWSLGERSDLVGQMASSARRASDGAADSGSGSSSDVKWCYIYGPKDDEKHRAGWRELYTEEEVERLKELVKVCGDNGVLFFYSLSPGLDIKYNDTEEVDRITAKFKQIWENTGCHNFAVFWDDIDASVNRKDLATWQSDVSNKVYQWLLQNVKGSTATPRLLFCPTEYCEMMAQPSLKSSVYLNTLAEHLNKNINIMWTGDDIIARTITKEHILEVTSVIKRKPFIWDNFFANDYDLRRIYCGPLYGRSQELIKEKLLSGFVLNPNREHAANFVPVFTLGEYANSKKTYNPKEAAHEAAKQWLPRFQPMNERTKDVITLEDVEWMIDIWYQPHQHGERSNKLIQSFKKLLYTKGTDEATRKEFESTTKEIHNVFTKLTCIKDRDLLHTFYSRAWEIKEEVLLLQDFVEHLYAHSKTEIPPYFNKFYKPGTFRGGVVADLQRLYNFNTLTSAVTVIPSKNAPLPEGWKIVPYAPEHLAGVYRVCLETGNSGQDGTHLFPNYPDIIGQRYIGPYVTLQPDLAFVLLDENNHVCGYVAGALDTKSFYERNEWMPKMREIYPNPPLLDNKAKWTPEEELIYQFHHPEFYEPETLLFAFKSHLHIDLIAKATGKGIGSTMIQTLLDRLKEKGSKGVFLEMSEVNHRAYHFYLKFGFVELARVDDCIIMGRTL